MRTDRLKLPWLLVLAGAVALAQPVPPQGQQGPAQGPPPQGQQPGQGGPQGRGGRGGQMNGPMNGPMGGRMGGPMERSLLPGPHGKWWDNPETAQKLSLTADQTKKMDDIFQQARLKLIDLNASVQKEETIMEPLVGADQPDEAKIVAQIDKVAQARAELEKANARMLLGIRRTLTADQWKKLQEEFPRRVGQQGQPGPGQPPRPPQKKG